MLAAGTRLGPYEIVSPLGAGGMGEVYRARDPRLGRDVALKVLPPHLGADPELRARFEREARTVSALDHPHICALYDVGREGDTEYLVMELLDGETLAQRLSRGALPAADVLRLGAQVADALDRAHRAGVVHRDLKPGNVMLTRSGAKLVDFGLARLTLPESGGLLGEDSRSLATSLTGSGQILGTVGYLAPEQVNGRRADARSDVFALGAVLFEMATGRRAFPGESAVPTLYAILNEEPPPLTSLAPAAPPALERTVRVCLAKDPDERWQSARDLARELRWIGEGSRALTAPATTRRAGAWPRAGLVATAAAAVALAAAASLFALRSPRVAPRVISSIDPPVGNGVSPHRGPMALSSDGRQIAFVAVDSAGTARIWVRDLAEAEPRPLAGTEGGASPFWSPDGRNLGFFANGRLQRIDLAGGPPQALADAPWSGGGAWGRDGTILFAGRMGEPVMRVAASGGAVTQAGRPDERSDWQAWPAWLPDGRHYLFFSFRDVGRSGRPASVYVGAVAGRDEPSVLLVGITHAVPAGTGHLVFWRDGALWAQAFDARQLRMSGEPRRIADAVVHDAELGCGLFAASPGGVVAYLHGGDSELSELDWVDRGGRALERVAEPAYWYAPRLSHDGRRLTATRTDPTNGSGDIWNYELTRRVGDRFTSDPAHEAASIWSVDDGRLYWMSWVGARGEGDIHTRALTGAGREETVFATDAFAAPLDATPDGRSLVILLAHGLRSGRPLGALAVLSLGDRKVTPWLDTAFDERQARLSRDGRWIAWMSDATGQREVYLRRFPEGGETWRVSTAGGESPVWRGDGRELYYVDPRSGLMSVALRTEPSVAIGTPVPLFRAALRPAGEGIQASYDVSADGQRFLIDRMVPVPTAGTITLDQNWSAR